MNVNMATFRFSLLNSHFYIPTVDFATVASCTTEKEGTMPAYMAQQLWSAALEPFTGASNNSTAAWIQSS
ncbi:hypothetical protein DSO57_1033317 [Entomophthora muscae]|uniref:Uncharacterized protein n=1 Tax=Entomophthora muscae TaxID=34485 RepID=A0ACC2SPQ7_9FUNG|nr:hypothetical protein DSO57_1033317 [Entomophthora muscae]